MGYAGRMGDTRNEYAILVGNSERKKTFERSRCKCLKEIRMNLKTLKTRSYYRLLYRLAEHSIANYKFCSQNGLRTNVTVKRGHIFKQR